MLKEHALVGEASEVGGQVMSNLRRLESIKGGDEDVGHGAFLFST